jgi:UDP-N-acetylmuramate dehydrogenase
MEIQEHVPLSTLTTFRTGGPARFLIEARDEADVRSAVAFAREHALPFIPLGGGSNLCAPDEGVNAAFVRFLGDRISVEPDAGNVSLAGQAVSAEAGLSWDSFVGRAVSERWWGVENLSGIPGTVGASVVQNIGAYGAAVGEYVVRVDAFDTKEGTMKEFTRAECAFGYRTSVFKKEPDRYFVLRVVFSFSKNPQPNLSYRDLKSRFQGMNPALQEIRDAVLEIRKGKFPSLSQYGTAGSFFLNPIVTAARHSVLAAQYPEMPLFAMPEGGVKVPVAWIFDHVLSIKGMKEGGAFVWDKQPLVLAAEYGARSQDVYVLAERIMRLAKEKTKIDLVPEVRMKF